MTTSSKCRPRNSAGRFRITDTPYQIRSPRLQHNPENYRFRLSVEASYLGSKNTRLGIPDANINQLPAQYLSLGVALLAKVANPYFGQIPASSSLGSATIAQQQLLRPYPRFTTVALFRNNVGNSDY